MIFHTMPLEAAFNMLYKYFRFCPVGITTQNVLQFGIGEAKHIIIHNKKNYSQDKHRKL